MPLGVRGNRTLRKWLERKKVLGMIKVTAEFEADSVDEMQGEAKAFLDALREYCDTDVVVATADEGETTEEIGIGYRYDDGDPINDALRELCEKAGVDDWRKIPLYGSFYGPPFGSSSDLFKVKGDGLNGFYLALVRANIGTLGDLMRYSEKDVSSIRGLGPKKMDRIRERLSELGLFLVAR